jgi:hypothetical protein
MIYAKELFSCVLGMDDFGDEEHKEDIGDEREEDKEEDNGDEGEEDKEEDIGDE